MLTGEELSVFPYVLRNRENITWILDHKIDVESIF